MTKPKHGLPDWGVTAGRQQIYQMNDLGELAARLGSIVSFDRRGDIVFLDDFADGLAHWQYGGIGTGHDVRITRRASRSGAYSIKLTSGSDGALSALIWHTGPLAFWSPTGAEFSFNLADLVAYLDLFLTTQDTVSNIIYGIRYARLANTLAYYDPAGAWVTFQAGVPTLFNAETFQTMKLVANPEASKYARLLVSGTTYDLSAFSPRVAGAAGAPLLSMEIEIIGLPLTNRWLLVDDAIITQNEPV